MLRFFPPLHVQYITLNIIVTKNWIPTSKWAFIHKPAFLPLLNRCKANYIQTKKCQHTCQFGRKHLLSVPCLCARNMNAPCKQLQRSSPKSSFLVKKKKCSCQKLSEVSPRCSTLSRNCVFHVLQDGLEAHTYQGRGTTEWEWKRVVSGLCQTQLCYFSYIAAYKWTQICTLVTNNAANIHRLWQLVTVFQNVWLICVSEIDTSTVNSPWCGWMTAACMWWL